MKKDIITVKDAAADILSERKRAPDAATAAQDGWRALTADQRIAMVRWRIEQMVGIGFAEWSDETQKMFRKLAEYMRQGQKRWLLLIGNVGVGKTTIARALAYCHNQATASQNEKMMILTAPTLAEYYRRDNVDEITRARKRRKILVDDVGTEAESLNVFGNAIYPFIDFISTKYDDPSSVVLLTTNLNSDEIAQRYGERILDRLIERCFIIKNNGKSLRH